MELIRIRRRTLEEAAVHQNLPPLVQIAAGSTSSAEARPFTGRTEKATCGPNQGGAAPGRAGVPGRGTPWPETGSAGTGGKKEKKKEEKNDYNRIEFYLWVCSAGAIWHRKNGLQCTLHVFKVQLIGDLYRVYNGLTPLPH